MAQLVSPHPRQALALQPLQELRRASSERRQDLLPQSCAGFPVGRGEHADGEPRDPRLDADEVGGAVRRMSEQGSLTG